MAENRQDVQGSERKTAPGRPREAVGSPMQPEKGSNKKARADKGRLHSSRHGVLSRYLLEALCHLGENPKTLRRREQQFRAALKPRGELGAILFDRFWSSYLRLVLVARLEASTLVPFRTAEEQLNPSASLVEGTMPVLLLPPETGGNGHGSAATVPVPDVFRQLALVQRYDRHFSREMNRTLAMLLLMRNAGEAGVADWIQTTLRQKKALFEKGTESVGND